MGPQPFGCGRGALGALLREEGFGFNGAATFRLRKVRARVLVDDLDRASMGPQPFGCGRAGLDAVAEKLAGLQWGRNLSVAEGSLY